jgi:ribosomal-protein-alanine N-acetyltransferase
MESIDIKISNMKLSDLEEISNNLETDFDDFWNYNIFKSELENPNAKYIVAKFNNKIVGFAGIIYVLDEADISNIVVHKNFRNKKIGSLLLKSLIDLAYSINLKTLNLEVRESNVSAIKLYDKFGFEVCGIRKNYYNNTENAILMKKLLDL